MAQSRSSNLFELLRDASEGSDGKKRKEEKKADTSAKAAAAPKAAPKKAEPTQKADAPKATATKAAPKSADAKPKQDRQEKPIGERKPRTENTNRELRPKGEGRPREDRRDKADRNRGDQVREDKGFVHPTKRAFERRSGTGRPFGGENKKGGAGRGNWGKPGSEQEALADVNSESVEQTEETPKTEETKETEPAAPKQLTPEEEEALKEKEKEERMLTLEEYRKKQEEEKAKIPLPQPRKAGEGSNDKKWANYQKLEKSEDSLFSTVQKKKGTAAPTTPATSSPGTKKNVVPVTDVLHVKQERKSERGGRDARGGAGRGRGQRGGGGGGRGKAEEFSLNEQAFPALSEKVKA